MAPPRRLYRDPKGPIGGVASGMAAYFEVDPVIVRLMWIVALLTGVGFPAYLVSWLVIPKAKVWPPDGYAQPASRDTRSAAIVSGLVIVGLAALIGKGIDGMGDLLLPAALIGFGVFLLNERSARASEAEAPTAPRPPAAAGASAAWAEAGGSWAHASGSQAGASTGSAPHSHDAADGPNGIVTPAVLSLLALAAGVCWALAAAGLVHPTVTGFVAGGLVLVGLGLLASLWLGRAPGLTLLGAGFTAVLVVSSAVEPWVQRAREFQAQGLDIDPLKHLYQGVGDRKFEPESLAELQPVYGLGVGELTLDLSQLDFSGTSHDVEVQLGMGNATIIVPEDVSLEAHGNTALGTASALDVTSEGMGVSVDASDPALGAGTLRVRFSVGMGEGMVRREE